MKKLSAKETNSETFSAITGQKYEPASNEVMCNKVNEFCKVKWLVSANEYQCCIYQLHQAGSRKWVCY